MKFEEAEHFWSRVNKKSRIFNIVDGKRSECWVWIGPLFHDGYGHVSGKRAHRISWKLKRGGIPKGLLVLHKCDNHPCVRPSHLFLGTQKENIADMLMKRRDNYAEGNRNGRYTHPERTARGERHGRAKLNAVHIKRIRKLYAAGYKAPVLARKFGMSKTTMYRIVNREYWKDV